MNHKIAHLIAGVSMGIVWFTMAGAVARANVGITSVGFVPTGVNYVNFDNLTPGSSAGGVSGGITVGFTPDGQTAQGSKSGIYAAPYLSNGVGTLFGDSTTGPDQTPYLTTGKGAVTLLLPGQERYLGLLWGSVDSYNTLSFYNGSTLVGSITGSQVISGANGNQGPSGTVYVNVNSTVGFDKVIATSTQYAFEFDNVAFATAAIVPEPSTFLVAMVGTAGLIAYGRLRRKGARATGAFRASRAG